MTQSESDPQRRGSFPSILGAGTYPLLVVGGELFTAPGIAPKIVGGFLAGATAIVDTYAGNGAELGKTRGLGGAGMITTGGVLSEAPGIAPKIVGGLLVGIGSLLSTSAAIDADLGNGSTIRTIKSVSRGIRARLTSR